MNTSLLLAPERTDLATLSLKDCPDLLTAVAAGEAHGLAPRDALKAAFMKWANDNAESVQRYKLANFYDGLEAPRAMVDYTALIQFLTIIVSEQGRQIAALRLDPRLAGSQPSVAHESHVQPHNDAAHQHLNPREEHGEAI